ncbi:hypothetical protein NDN08_004128 [Rhodosorus marinus]|uniref:Pentacotripeptide-repeat region of PRORP domain-containing protein n=1 Tax=Rhodosorus marinus TaxID=101924 RepID=A0AAV8UHE2_9RHOD|nr:hypothetical protein NDN08_004128 [Rhodosorus marinus]
MHRFGGLLWSRAPLAGSGRRYASSQLKQGIRSRASTDRREKQGGEESASSANGERQDQMPGGLLEQPPAPSDDVSDQSDQLFDRIKDIGTSGPPSSFEDDREQTAKQDEVVRDFQQELKQMASISKRSRSGRGSSEAGPPGLVEDAWKVARKQGKQLGVQDDSSSMREGSKFSTSERRSPGMDQDTLMSLMASRGDTADRAALVIREIEKSARISSSANLRKLERIVREDFDFNRKLVSSLISGYSNAGDYGGSGKLFLSLPQNAKTGAVTRSWLSASLNVKNAPAIAEISSAMFDSKTYMTNEQMDEVVNLLISFKMYEQVMRVLGQQATVFPPERIGCVRNNILKAITHLVDEDMHDFAAYQLVSVLSKSGLRFDRAILEAAVKCMAGEPARIEATIASVQETASRAPSDKTWEVLANAYASLGDILSTNLTIARAAYAGARYVGPRVVIRLYGKSGQTAGVLREFQSIKKPCLGDFNLILRSGLTAEQVLPEIHRHSLIPNGETFGILSAIVYKRRGADLKALSRIVDSMRAVKVDVHDVEYKRELFTELVNTYDEEEVLSVLAFLDQFSNDYGRDVASRLIRALIRHNKLEEAEKIATKRELDDSGKEALSFGYMRKGNVKAAEVWANMVHERSEALENAISRASEVTPESKTWSPSAKRKKSYELKTTNSFLTSLEKQPKVSEATEQEWWTV